MTQVHGNTKPHRFYGQIHLSVHLMVFAEIFRVLRRIGRFAETRR